MTSEELYRSLGSISDRHIAGADAPPRAASAPLLRWGLLAACLCLAAIGILAAAGTTGTPGGPPSAGILQPDEAPTSPSGSSHLMVNEVESTILQDLDVQISHYSGLTGDAWEAVLDRFEAAFGLSYGAFTARIPATFTNTAFYSVDAPTTPLGREYLPHDYVFEYQTADGGKAIITLCPGQEPLRDCILLCDAPQPSAVNGVSVLLFEAGEQFTAQFSCGSVYCDISASRLTLEEMEALLSALTAPAP